MESHQIDLNDFTSALYLTITEENHKRDHKLEPHQLRVSSFHLCSRNQFYAKLYPQPKPTQKEEGIFFIGNMFHDFIETRFKKFFIDVEREIKAPLSEDCEAIGHYDIKMIASEIEVIVDLKTIASETYYMLNEPKESHQIQANYYCGLDDVQYYIIIYINKDTFELKYFIKPFDPALYEATRKKEIALWGCIKRNEKPEKNPSKNECSYCIYKSLCDLSLAEISQTLSGKEPVNRPKRQSYNPRLTEEMKNRIEIAISDRIELTGDNRKMIRLKTEEEDRLLASGNKFLTDIAKMNKINNRISLNQYYYAHKYLYRMEN